MEREDMTAREFDAMSVEQLHELPAVKTLFRKLGQLTAGKLKPAARKERASKAAAAKAAGMTEEEKKIHAAKMNEKRWGKKKANDTKEK